jgi:hypothetical protein
MITSTFLSPLVTRVLAGAALTAALTALLTMWLLLQDPVGMARAVQRDGVTGVATTVAHDVWRRVSTR